MCVGSETYSLAQRLLGIIRLLGVFLALGITVDVRGSVSDICGSLPVARAKTVGELKEFYSVTCNNQKFNDPVRKIAKDVYDLLSNLDASKTIDQVLTSRSNTERKLVEQFRLKVNDLSIKLGEFNDTLAENAVMSGDSWLSTFIKKYRDRSKTNAKDYFLEARAMLAQTQTGKEILQCWERTKDSFLAEQNLRSEISNTFLTRFATKQSENAVYSELYGGEGKSIRQIVLDHNVEPVRFFHVLGHEMVHGCDIDLEKANHTCMLDYAAFSGLESDCRGDRCKKSKPFQVAAFKLAKSQAELDEATLISECRAHALEVKLFEELANLEPAYVCNRQIMSIRYDYRVISSGSYMASLQDSFEKRTFVGDLIELYGKLNYLNPKNVCELNPIDNEIIRDTEGKCIPRQDLRQRLKAYGCD